MKIGLKLVGDEIGNADLISVITCGWMLLLLLLLMVDEAKVRLSEQSPCGVKKAFEQTEILSQSPHWFKMAAMIHLLCAFELYQTVALAINSVSAVSEKS